MTKLELFLDRMREDITRKAEQLKNLGKPHRFPCPYCTRDVQVSYGTDGVSYTLRHKVPGCISYDKPNKETNNDLLTAFVFHCRPPAKFESIDSHFEKGNPLR